MDHHQIDLAIDMSIIDESSHLIGEENDVKNGNDSLNYLSNTPTDPCDNSSLTKDVVPTLSMCSDSIIEKIEDKRVTCAENTNLRKRFAYSENDISFAGINKSMAKMKEQLEQEFKKKMCKECLFRSIQSKLSMLGIVSASNRNICVVEGETEHLHETSNDVSSGDDENSNRTPATLLENLNKRTVCPRCFCC